MKRSQRPHHTGESRHIPKLKPHLNHQLDMEVFMLEKKEYTSFLVTILVIAITLAVTTINALRGLGYI